MLRKFLRLTGLDSDLQQMSVSVETRALGMIDQARAMAVRSALVIAVAGVALMMLMFAIAIALVALYFYLAARYDPTTALAVVAGGLFFVVLILAIVALSIAKSPAGPATINPVAPGASAASQAVDRAAGEVAGAAQSAADDAKAAAASVAASAQRTTDSASHAADQAAARVAQAAASAGASNVANEPPSLSAAADAIFRTFGSQVNNEKDFMSSTMSVLGHFVRTPKTGVGPIDDMIDNVSPRMQAVGEEVANQAAEFVRTSDRTTFWSVLGAAAAIGFMVARNNNPPKA